MFNKIIKKTIEKMSEEISLIFSGIFLCDHFLYKSTLFLNSTITYRDKNIIVII